MSILSSVPIIWIALGAVGLGLVALVVAIVAMSRAAGWKRRYFEAFSEAGQTVDEVVIDSKNRAEQAEQSVREMGLRVEQLETRQQHNFDKLGMVRFNPFGDTGADLSFSLAVLNDLGDGWVMTSLWGRDEVRVYAKSVEAKDSRYALSQEERQAIDMAHSSRQRSRSEAPGDRSRDKRSQTHHEI